MRDISNDSKHLKAAMKSANQHLAESNGTSALMRGAASHDGRVAIVSIVCVPKEGANTALEIFDTAQNLATLSLDVENDHNLTVAEFKSDPFDSKLKTLIVILFHKYCSERGYEAEDVLTANSHLMIETHKIFMDKIETYPANANIDDILKPIIFDVLDRRMVN